MVATDYQNLTASELLDLRSSLDKKLDHEQIELLNSIIEERRQSIKQQLAKNNFDYKYSTFIPRISAFILDILLFYALRKYLYPEFIASVNDVLLIFLLLDFLLYSVISHALWGQTLGKKIIGIKVLNYEDQAAITLVQALIRDALPIVAMAGFFLRQLDADSLPLLPENIVVVMNVYLVWYVIEFASLLLHKKSRAVQDHLAATLVKRF